MANLIFKKQLLGAMMASLNKATTETVKDQPVKDEIKPSAKLYEIIDTDSGFTYRDFVTKWYITIEMPGAVKLYDQHPDRIKTKEYIKYDQLSLHVDFWGKLAGLLLGCGKRIESMSHELTLRETAIDVLKSDLENQAKKIAFIGTNKKEAFFAGMQAEKAKHGLCNKTV
jgi:hypothetical protein